MLLPRRLGLAIVAAGTLMSNPASASPERSTRDLISAFGADLRVVFQPGTETPRSLSNLAELTVGTTPAEKAASFLSSSRKILGLAHLEVRMSEVKNLPRSGSVVRFGLFADGLEVEGRTVSVKLDAEGRVRSVQSDAVPFLLPKIAQELPAAVAVETVKQRYQIAAAGAPTKVVMAHAADVARVAWRVPVAVIPLQAHFFVWVDAENGDILREAPAGFDQPMKRIPVRTTSKEVSK
jgi:Zn-dependent metalloprotease